MGNSDFKPQMEGAGGPQPKKRRKNANAANANAVNNTASKLISCKLETIENR